MELTHQSAVGILQHAIDHVLNVPDAVYLLANAICGVCMDGAENGILVDPLYGASDLAAMACMPGSGGLDGR